MTSQRVDKLKQSRDEFIVGPPRWVPLLLSVAATLLLGYGFSYFVQQDSLNHVIGKPANLGPSGPITSLAEITSEWAKDNLVGRAVMMNDVPVQSVVGDHLFWVGESESKRVPVYLFGEGTARQEELETEVHVGQKLRIFGYVAKFPDLNFAAASGLVSDDEKRAIARQPVIISGWRVEIEAGQPGRRPAAE